MISLGAAALLGGGALLGGLAGSRGARSAARDQRRGIEASIGEQRRQFDLTRQDLAPYREVGEENLNRLNALMGGDMSGFYLDPGYQFALEEGERGINRLAAATGRLGSGGHFKDISRFNQGLAAQGFGDYYNRLAGLAGTGQSATTQGAQLGSQISGNIAALQRDRGAANAAGTLGHYGAMANTVNQLANLYGMYGGAGRAGGVGGFTNPSAFSMGSMY